MKWLYDAVTMGNPLNYKPPLCLWTANTIRALLEKERGVRLSKSGVCRLLGQSVLSPQRPLHKSYKQDPEKVRVYLSETCPEVVAKAKRHRARLYFMESVILAALRSIQGKVDLVKSFFRLPTTLYAKDYG